jgi:AAA domain
MALQRLLFPIDHPVMPEERQIGRLPSIEGLERQINMPAHQWLIGPRRIGKTSVAKAVIARLRVHDAVALDVDIANLGISTSQELAGEIARQAQAAGAGVPRPDRRVLNRLSRQASNAGILVKSVAELGFNSEAEALDVVASLLATADRGEPGLDKVLDVLALHAMTTGQRVVILLDEVQRLAGLDDDCEETVSRWARKQDSPLVFIFAGSEESAVRALRKRGRPLASVGTEFKLPTISTEDWLHGLAGLFREAQVTIAREELLTIIEAADAHPRRTMLIAHHVHVLADEQAGLTATPTLVGLAIRDTHEDRSWA